MTFTTVRIEGSIFTSEILDKVAAGEVKGRNPIDFGLNQGMKVKDEIAGAWADSQRCWQSFKRQRERIQEGASGAGETRTFWIVPLLKLLGYEAQYTPKAEVIENQTYSISHRASNWGDYPIHIVGFNESLDERRGTGGTRLSPHGLVQEYLNVTEHLYSLVTNGIYLRLLRDSTRLVRLSYIEFDLDSMMKDENFADFALMFRLLHVTRMPVKIGAGAESLIESYHQDSLESGTRIREGLSKAVEDAIKTLGDGFLKHSSNTRLRSEIEEGKLSAVEYYQSLLRVIYRLLFLMVIEERRLIYDKGVDSAKREIYYEYYSVSQLRKRSENFRGEREAYTDLWIALTHTFRIFEEGEKGRILGIQPLSGQLFAQGAIGILNESVLENRDLLSALKSLSVFENAQTRQRIRVNYGSLNVEEFGSVYEGLLEYTPEVITQGGRYEFIFKEGKERSTSGSHYTPEDLVQPLIKHSLEHVIEEKLKHGRTKEERVKALLSINCCDATCGSGHILLSAARRIGAELAKERTGEDQPSPVAIREGIRDAITHCIYGVDKNPLAVELCKVALWLEAHNPGKPLNFLDHRIKCGDAIVGLAHKEELEEGIPDEAYNKMPGDDAEVVKEYSRRNKKERKEGLVKLKDYTKVIEPMNNIVELFRRFNEMPEGVVEEIERKEGEYKKILTGENWKRIKSIADIKVAQFFIPKTRENEGLLVTESDYRECMKGNENVTKVQEEVAKKEGRKGRYFHWFLEYPEVFIKGGFDCIIGNPPYLGGKNISSAHGLDYLNYLKVNFFPTSGQTDLVAYFLRRIYELIMNERFIALLTTNTISQGDTRYTGLAEILNRNASIIYAVKSMKWPGRASLEISLLSIFKGNWNNIRYLNSNAVENINSYLLDEDAVEDPKPLSRNKNKLFKGVFILGDGFILTEEEKKSLISIDKKNETIIFPLINGKEINAKFNQAPDRYIINFFDWSEEEAQKYAEPYRIIKETVYPIRQKLNRKIRKERWWQYAEKSVGLQDSLLKIKYCFCVVSHTKYLSFIRTPSTIVFTAALFVYTDERYSHFCILQSIIHEAWARNYSSTIKMDLRYTPSDCFETYPFPQEISAEMEAELEKIGETYHESRRLLMHKMELGLTKTYNLFHKKDLTIQDIINESKKDTTTAETAYRDILQLRELHKHMDTTVLNAYKWTDINLNHDFYEVEYLPENDRVRFTITPEARKEILKRLLLLNHHIHQLEEEQKPTAPPKPKPTDKPQDLHQKTLF